MKNTAKRALSVLLCMVMVLGLVGIAPTAMALDSCGYDCDGSVEQLLKATTDATEGQCYRIVNNDDIIALADYVAAGRNTKGVTFYLKADVDMRKNTWNGIGTAGHPFEGTLDGCGFAVVGLITYLFAYAGTDATIMNLGVNGVSNGADAAGIASHLSGTIANCWNAVKVNGTGNNGGLAAVVSGGKIINSANYAKVSGTGNVGAVAGKVTNAEISDVYYTYYSADKNIGSIDNSSSVDTMRFASSPTMCPTEEEKTVGSVTSDDLLQLLNAWIAADGGAKWRKWVFDASAETIERTGGKYPAQAYPGYAAEEPVYKDSVPMSTLYESQADAQEGVCYSIGDVKELEMLANFVNEGHNTEGATFFLTADLSIVINGSFYKGESWVPIGNSEQNSFKGTFDGQGFVINELIIKKCNDPSGLFGYVNSSKAVIKNVGVGGGITANAYAGGIVGYLKAGAVENCWVGMNVNGDKATGGIVGYADSGNVYNCAFYANATDNHKYGAIVGEATANTNVRYCYYSSDNSAVSGTPDEGNYQINVPFKVTNGVYTLTRSVNINGNKTLKVLNALNYWVDTLGAKQDMRHWKQDASPESIARLRGTFPAHIYYNDPSQLEYIKETDEELDRTDNPYNVIYKRTATMTELYDSKTDAIAGGNYSISTGDEMGLLSKYVQEGYSTKNANFYLTDDINIATQGIDVEGAGWVPIGTTLNNHQGIQTITYFRGNFDGCGYTVSGLYIVSDFIDMAGLFGQCWGSTIRNLGVAGEMLADDEVGGIVGRANSCTIENCWSSVIIQASTEVGGIVGYAHNSTISNCAAYGPLYTTSDEGEKAGFVGRSNGSTISNCYYLYGLIDDFCNKTDKDSVFNDCMYFRYDIDGDQKCTLQKAITVDSYTGDDMLEALNGWVYKQDNELYCTWHIASSINEIPGANGYFPVLMNPSVNGPEEDKDYCGDYTATNTMSALYSTRSDGVEGGCYSISNMDDLIAFRKYVNEGYKTRRIIFFMTRDIDMSYTYSAASGTSWTPVGTVKDPFKGIFDGQGYTIKYLYISSYADDQGFFGQVTGTDAVVKNLGISGSVTAKGVNTAAICADFNFGTIANCWTSCEVAGAANTGGIIGGGNMGTVINCTSYGAVIGASTYGAIAGAPVGTKLQYCYYLYGSCQQGYPSDGDYSVIYPTVQSFNGTGGVCILGDYVTVEGTRTKNASSALKLYVDAHPEINYCYWGIGDSEEYYLMGVTGFPVLISASNTKGEHDYKVAQAEFNGKQYYSVVTAVKDANAYEGGGTVKLLVNSQLKNREDITLDDDVTIDTSDFSLIIMSNVSVKSLNQLLGTYIIKDSGLINLDGKKFIYSNRNADDSCNSEIYGKESLTIQIKKTDDPTAYDLTLRNGEFIVNAALDSGNPHKIPGGSKLTVHEKAILNIEKNARIRTTGGAEVYDYGTIKIGNATLDRNKGSRMVGVLEDDNGKVSLPFIYYQGYHFTGWSDGTNTYPAGSTVDVPTAKTFTPTWRLGDRDDPYPGDDFYDDNDEPVYNLKITVIQSEGGSISPESINAAKGESLSFKVTPSSGYYIKNVLVDGKSVSLDENGYYTFVSLGEDHSITALFAKTANQDYDSYRMSFTDVTRDDWYYNNVRFACSMGLMKGTSDTLFSPDEQTSRAQFITVLWRLSGSPVMPGGTCQFTDVPSGSYYYDAVRWGVAYGIVNGYSATSFGPNNSITREQLITMLFRYAKNYAGDDVSQYDSTNILGYSDVLQISRGMTQAFQWGIGAGIINGTSDTTLTPQGTATRAQVAAFLSRYCNKFVLKVPVMMN